MLSFGLNLASNAKIIRSVDEVESSGPTFPLTPTDSQVWLLTELIPAIESEVPGDGLARPEVKPGLYVYLADKSGWYSQLDDSNAYDISININRRYMQNDTLTTFLVPRVVQIPLNFKGSGAVAQVPATNEVEFKIFIESGDPAIRTQIGKITFPAGSRIGKVTPFSLDTGYVLVPNDLLTVESGMTVDVTLNKISITLATSLVV